MKLRNKKTGEIGRLYFDHQLIDPKTGTYAIVIQHRDKFGYEAFANYFTLAKLNEEWEDYKPAEPLIKDEKTRKAVRAWAEVNSIEEVIYAERADRNSFTLINMSRDDYRIELVGCVPTLEDAETYTIAELCGDSEEEE